MSSSIVGEQTDQEPVVEFIDLRVEETDVVSEVLAGLRASPKRIAAKYFYDEAGSALFEQITRLPEYYLTRTELSILTERAGEMVSRFGPRHALIEFGSGSSRKVRILLDAAESTAVYMPIDISAEFLKEAARRIALDYPALEVIAVCADYTALHLLPESGAAGRRVVFFPGSTLGNLEPEEARRFFCRTAALLRQGDGMLIGVDLRKEKSILDAAYNDSQGVTAEFNRNILRRINHDFDAGFDVSSFEHESFYDAGHGRIEMHLRATRDQVVHIAGESIAIRAGEKIHTENSYKYDESSFARLLDGSSFQLVESWTDAEARFAVHYLEIRSFEGVKDDNPGR